jgi:dTDP-4-amino-4,6-dideoxygalactose transaminase
MIELFRPSVPPIELYLPYLKRVDANRMYSNFGPVQAEFKERLASLFGMKSEQLELFSSGTMALIAALTTLKDAKRPYCILPSWTFVATAHSVVAAGLEPIFVDVDLHSMQATQKEIGSLPQEILEKASVVLLVAPFGASLKLDGIDQLSKKYGFAVLCDCAAGFESVKSPVFPTVVSLHATKMFGVGEGGVLISPDEDLIKKSHAYINFGFDGGREAKHQGVNGKLSEFQAAVGMGGLDAWPESLELYRHTANLYLQAGRDVNIEFQDGWGKNWLSSTCVIRLPSPEIKKRLEGRLLERGIQYRNWWNNGCHHEIAFAGAYIPHKLQNTEYLANTTLGIPFFRDISEASIASIFESLGKLHG